MFLLEEMTSHIISYIQAYCTVYIYICKQCNMVVFMSSFLLLLLLEEMTSHLF
jgi:hypothetical protein